MKNKDKIIRTGMEDIEVLADSVLKHLTNFDTYEEKEEYLKFFDTTMFTYLLARKLYEKSAWQINKKMI